MKLITIVALVAGLAIAQPHRHSHHHKHKRQDVVTDTVIVYELNGHPISAQQVQEGLANGTLILAPSGAVESAAPAAAPAPAAAAPAAPAAPAAAAPAKAPSAASPGVKKLASGSQSSGTNSFSNSATGLTAEFPDNQIACSDFPSQYGAVPVSWLGLGGYTGVQHPGSDEGGFANIETIVSSLCSGGECCTEGSFCSYACPAGYQKTQWPATQGATGQSVGGLLCQNGKLQLTNPGLSKSLCMKGTEAVNVQVKNVMSQTAAVCRTDYPGTEGETVPLNAIPNAVIPLTTPEGDNYYMWEGKSTSAQYYVNNAGVSVQDACRWGTPESNAGNFAPMNIGAGYSNGAAYLSIFQNAPTTNSKLNYDVELVGDNGGFENIQGKCKYFSSTGEYCSGDNYESCNSNGCTSAVPSGTATFVFSN